MDLAPEYEGLRRAASIAASQAGAEHAWLDGIAEESVALLFAHDDPVNNPKAWVRRTASRLAVEAYRRSRLGETPSEEPLGRPWLAIRDVLATLSEVEQELVIGFSRGLTVRELSQRIGIDADSVQILLTGAQRACRRNVRGLATA